MEQRPWQAVNHITSIVQGAGRWWDNKGLNQDKGDTVFLYPDNQWLFLKTVPFIETDLSEYREPFSKD